MIKPFNYFWRLFATGLSFSLFGLGGVFLRFFIFPVVGFIYSNKQQRILKSRWWIHRGFYFFIGFMHRMRVMTYKVEGLEKLNQPGQLIIANHPTLIDIVFLISRIPAANCIVKAKLWHNPFMKGPVVNAGYISNENPEKMIADSVTGLNAGEVLVIFPEGTRSVTDTVYKFQRSAAHIALQAKTIVTPVTISCTPSTLTKNQKWYQIPERRFHLSMQVGDNILMDDFLAIETRSIAVRHLNRYLQNYFEKQRECDE